MKQVYIIHENHPKLLLLFAGWASDETPFKQYRPKGMDYMICYDYRTLDFDKSVFQRYEQVNVVSWSMGVWVGSLILSNVPGDNVLSMAFNGSTSPICDIEGIPLKTYRATLDNLTPASLQKFMRRMCKDSKAYKAFMEITPRRNFDEIKEELRLIKEQFFEMHGDVEQDDEETLDEKSDEYYDMYNYDYDYVFIGNNDRIFPPENMKMNNEDFYPGKLIITDSAHYDEPMFRFLLQDAWEMPIDDFTRHLNSINVECYEGYND